MKESSHYFLVFNFIEEQHFQVSLSFQHYSYMIISSGHCRRQQSESQGNAQTRTLRPVCSVGCFTLKSPENKRQIIRRNCIALKDKI